MCTSGAFLIGMIWQRTTCKIILQEVNANELLKVTVQLNLAASFDLKAGFFHFFFHFLKRFFLLRVPYFFHCLFFSFFGSFSGLNKKDQSLSRNKRVGVKNAYTYFLLFFNQGNLMLEFRALS